MPKKGNTTNQKLFWYHSIEPRGSSYLNTFIERPWIHARLLYWLAAQHDVDGWLYYSTNKWKTLHYPKTHHLPIRRLSESPRTDFDPANYIWADKTLFANGDGQIVYPGENAPIASARLELLRDANEDVFLLRQAKKVKHSDSMELMQRLVRSPTDYLIIPTHRRNAIGCFPPFPPPLF